MGNDVKLGDDEFQAFDGLLNDLAGEATTDASVAQSDAITKQADAPSAPADSTMNSVRDTVAKPETPEASQLPDDGWMNQPETAVDEKGVPIKNRLSEFERKLSNTVDSKISQLAEKLDSLLNAGHKPASNEPSTEFFNYLAKTNPEYLQETYSDYQQKSQLQQQTDKLAALPEYMQRLEQLERQTKEQEKMQIEAFLSHQRAQAQSIPGSNARDVRLGELEWEKSGYQGQLSDYVKREAQERLAYERNTFKTWFENAQKAKASTAPASSDGARSVQPADDRPLDLDEDTERFREEMARDMINRTT